MSYLHFGEAACYDGQDMGMSHGFESLLLHLLGCGANCLTSLGPFSLLYSRVHNAYHIADGGTVT